MSKGKRELSGDEKKLWRRVAASVKSRRPLPAEPEDDAPAPAAKTVRAAAKSSQPVKPTPRTPQRASAPPQNRAGEKRVRRGKLDIGGTLDLHGHTQESARAALARFLASAQRRGESTVIVVTGKGRAGEGMLKRRFPEWLSGADIRPLISGFAQAHQTHGGAGAFYVFIKRQRESSE